MVTVSIREADRLDKLEAPERARALQVKRRSSQANGPGAGPVGQQAQLSSLAVAAPGDGPPTMQ